MMELVNSKVRQRDKLSEKIWELNKVIIDLKAKSAGYVNEI